MDKQASNRSHYCPLWHIDLWRGVEDETTSLHNGVALADVVGADQHPLTASAASLTTTTSPTAVLAAAAFAGMATTGEPDGQGTAVELPGMALASAVAETGAAATAAFERLFTALTDRLTQMAQVDAKLVAVMALLLGGDDAIEEAQDTPASLPYSVAMLLMVNGWEMLAPEGQTQIAVALRCAASDRSDLAVQHVASSH